MGRSSRQRAILLEVRRAGTPTGTVRRPPPRHTGDPAPTGPSNSRSRHRSAASGAGAAGSTRPGVRSTAPPPRTPCRHLPDAGHDRPRSPTAPRLRVCTARAAGASAASVGLGTRRGPRRRRPRSTAAAAGAGSRPDRRSRAAACRSCRRGWCGERPNDSCQHFTPQQRTDPGVHPDSATPQPAACTSGASAGRNGRRCSAPLRSRQPLHPHRASSGRPASTGFGSSRRSGAGPPGTSAGTCTFTLRVWRRLR
jgi:hypothetical protein